MQGKYEPLTTKIKPKTVVKTMNHRVMKNSTLNDIHIPWPIDYNRRQGAGYMEKDFTIPTKPISLHHECEDPKKFIGKQNSKIINVFNMKILR